jgi:PAS domain S-box-containing protein
MRNSASRTALAYAVLAGLMIMIDLVVDSLAANGQVIRELHVVSAVSAMLLLYFYLNRELRARERAEAHRRTSEQRLASLLDTAIDAIIAVGEDRRIFLFNQGAQRIFGYPAQEVVGQPLDLLLPPRFTEAHSQHFHDFALMAENTLRMDNRREVFGRRKDGSEFPAEAGISKVIQDRQITFTVILHDITQRKHAEEALGRANTELELRVQERTIELTQSIEALHAEIAERRRIEEERALLLVQIEQARRQAEELAKETQLANGMLYTLIETMPAGVMVADADGAIILTNRTANMIMGGAVTGTAHGPRGGYTLHRIDGSLLPPEELPLFRAIQRGEITKNIEALVRRKDGVEVAILAAGSPVCDESGRVISGIMVYQDITAHKLLQQELQQSEETASALINASPESALLVDTQGKVLAANEIAAQRLHTTVSQLIGSRAIEFFPPHVAASRSAHLEEVVRTGQPAHFEDERSGRLMDNYIQPVCDAGGSVIRLAIFGYDVTERKQVEEQRARLAALEERQHLARELHDTLSQNLYGIALGAHTALTLLDSDRSKVVEALDYILSLADSGLTEMRALIFDLRPESLQMEGLVTALAKQSAAVHVRDVVEISTDLCAEPDVPLETKEAIYRIAQEALHNAVKHAQAGRLDLQLYRSGENIVLEISDDGVGFDPTMAFPGHLGLRSMYERATRLGGTLEIYSSPGDGTHIRAQFPSPGESS